MSRTDRHPHPPVLVPRTAMVAGLLLVFVIPASTRDLWLCTEFHLFVRVLYALRGTVDDSQ